MINRDEPFGLVIAVGYGNSATLLEAPEEFRAFQREGGLPEDQIAELPVRNLPLGPGVFRCRAVLHSSRGTHGYPEEVDVSLVIQSASPLRLSPEIVVYGSEREFVVSVENLERFGPLYDAVAKAAGYDLEVREVDPQDAPTRYPQSCFAGEDRVEDDVKAAPERYRNLVLKPYPGTQSLRRPLGFWSAVRALSREWKV